MGNTVEIPGGDTYFLKRTSIVIYDIKKIPNDLVPEEVSCQDELRMVTSIL